MNFAQNKEMEGKHWRHKPEATMILFQQTPLPPPEKN